MNKSNRISILKILLISGGVVVALVMLLAVIFLVFLAPGKKSTNLTARMSEISGEVQVRPASAEQYTDVGNDYILTTEMQMQTLQESRVRLDLSTGSIVRIGQLTIFSLNSRGNASNGVLSRLTLQAGQLWVVLNGGSLDVTTSGGTASVRGSYMFVSVDPKANSLKIECLEGSCRLQNNAGSLDLTSGQKVISSDPNRLPEIQPMDQNDAQLWLANVPEASTVVPQEEAQFATSTPAPTSGYHVDSPYFGVAGGSLLDISGTICEGFNHSFQLHGENTQAGLSGDFTFSPANQGRGTWTFTGTAEDYPFTSSGAYAVQGVPGGIPASQSALGPFAEQISQEGTPALLIDAGLWQVSDPASGVVSPPLLDAQHQLGMWAIPLEPAGAGECPGK